MTARNDHELLSKAAVIREYGFPEHQLEADLKHGKIPYFTSNGQRLNPDDYYNLDCSTRYYIPRCGVEARIRELSGMEEAS